MRYNFLNKVEMSTIAFFGIIMVATAQGKRGIWMLTFPDREITGNFVNFLHRENFGNTGKILSIEQGVKFPTF